MSNLITKVSDDMFAFVKSSMWMIAKNRYAIYQSVLRTQISISIRHQEWHDAARMQGMIDAVDDIIRITERLPKEISEGEFDVDAALNVIENKSKLI